MTNVSNNDISDVVLKIINGRDGHRDCPVELPSAGEGGEAVLSRLLSATFKLSYGW